MFSNNITVENSLLNIPNSSINFNPDDLTFDETFRSVPFAMTSNNFDVSNNSVPWYNQVYQTTSSSGTPYFAFDLNNSTNWSSDLLYSASTGTYTGSKSLGGYSGEWIKIYYPNSILTGNFSFSSFPGGLTFWCPPRLFYVLGSNDNSTWDTLYTSGTTTLSNNTLYTYTGTTARYKYVAIVINKVSNPSTSQANSCILTSFNPMGTYYYKGGAIKFNYTTFPFYSTPQDLGYRTTDSAGTSGTMSIGDYYAPVNLTLQAGIWIINVFVNITNTNSSYNCSIDIFEWGLSDSNTAFSTINGYAYYNTDVGAIILGTSGTYYSTMRRSTSWTLQLPNTYTIYFLLRLVYALGTPKYSTSTYIQAIRLA